LKCPTAASRHFVPGYYQLSSGDKKPFIHRFCPPMFLLVNHYK
jgi:hypothetical protein